jgi:hypothetical protein
MPFNDTYGEISDEEQAALRASARTCRRCGMVASIDPAFHAQRYGHAPVINDQGRTLEWTGAGWEAAERPAEPCGVNGCDCVEFASKARS